MNGGGDANAKSSVKRQRAMSGAPPTSRPTIATSCEPLTTAVRGEPGLTGAVAVDGVNQQFPLFVEAYDAYVAHVVVPQGVYQPFAHVSARVQLPDGEFRYFTLPNTVPLVTATPQSRPIATPAPTAPPVRRRPMPTPAPTPLPRRPLSATSTPLATPAPPRPAPAPTATMRIIPKVAPTHHIMPRERPAATPSPKPT